LIFLRLRVLCRKREALSDEALSVLIGFDLRFFKDLKDLNSIAMTTMTNDDSIADGVPMNLEQMRLHLQECHGCPVALREQGSATCRCPCCDEVHKNGPQPGCHSAWCDDQSPGVVVAGRSFHCDCGYTIFECKKERGVNVVV